MITKKQIVEVIIDELSRRYEKGDLGEVAWDEDTSDYENWEVLLKNTYDNKRGFSLAGSIELTLENYCGYDDWVMESHTLHLDSIDSLSSLPMFKKDIKVAIGKYVNESIKAGIKYRLNISNFITNKKLELIQDFTSLTVRINSTPPRIEILEVIKD